MTDYTPTTEEVRMYYRHPEGSRIAWYVSPDEFDRWFADVKAKAWDEGFTHGSNSPVSGQTTDNPYRQES